jgi:hypothetical protein
VHLPRAIRLRIRRANARRVRRRSLKRLVRKRSEATPCRQLTAPSSTPRHCRRGPSHRVWERVTGGSHSLHARALGGGTGGARHVWSLSPSIFLRLYQTAHSESTVDKRDNSTVSTKRLGLEVRAASAALVSVFHRHHVAHPQQVQTNSSVERWNSCKGRGPPQSKHSTSDMMVEGPKGGQSDAWSNR